MPSKADVDIIGNLMRDAEYKYPPEGRKGYVMNLVVAHNWGPADKQSTAVYHVTANISQRQYERDYENFKKGMPVSVRGSLRPKSEQIENGYTRYSFLNVNYANVMALGGRGSNGVRGPQGSAQTQRRQEGPPPPNRAEGAYDRRQENTQSSSGPLPPPPAQTA